MLRIALLDDDNLFLPQLENRIDSFLNTKHKMVNTIISSFSNSASLLSRIENTYYDVFFLDVEMPYFNGLQIAEIIRNKQPLSIIIFVTSFAKYALEGYKVQALRYLTKPIDQDQLEEALEKSLDLCSRYENGALSIVSYGNITRIPYQEILYVCHVMRVCLIHTLSMGEIKDRRGINEIFAMLEDERFVFIDRGTFVNADHIMRLEASRLYLHNGESLIISRRMLPSVKLTINRLLGGT